MFVIIWCNNIVALRVVTIITTCITDIIINTIIITVSNIGLF